ncbi:MAG: glutathione S-transferase C-terminal domain-containing protein [Lachnospiraceae bacterium]|nr:glutathione S-transferase C-terminal domain-containing protein [Lachnospiraceae bacterium]
MGCCEFNTKAVSTEEILQSYTDELAEQFAAEAGGLAPRPNEQKDETNERGVFVRQPNSFIKKFGNKEDEFKAENKRYAIYWAHGCNWSNRPVIARDLLGLQDVIADQTTSHTGTSNKYGHGFSDQPEFKDPITGVHFLSEFYKNAKPDYKGRATTPTLVDVMEKKAVNNDYHRLSNYIEVQFRKFQPVDAPDLYPKKYRKEIDELNDWLFPHINNGHYRMAFGVSWEAYSEGYDDFFDSLEKLDKRLETNRFLFGDYITDSDIRAYVSLVRWETGYFRNIGPMKKRITEYKNIWGYIKDLYSIPTFAKYTFFHDGPPRKTGMGGPFKGYEERIVPLIPFEELWKSDGERKKLSSDPVNIFLKHPEGETAEDYQSEISDTIWNSPSWEDREPTNYRPDFDVTVNPLRGLLSNN